MGDYNKAANGEQAGETPPNWTSLKTTSLKSELVSTGDHSHSRRGFSPVTHRAWFLSEPSAPLTTFDSQAIADILRLLNSTICLD
jgi:hypothetical protein